MKINKTIKRVVIITLSTVVFLFIILVAHIATAKPVDNAYMQVSRIDFSEPLDSAKVKEIHRNLKSIPGVKSDHFNIEKGVLVYFHDNRVADSKKIYEQLMDKGHYKAHRYILPKELASKQVCPVMNHDGFSYKFSKKIQQIFN
jgi:hypothetical protein